MSKSKKSAAELSFQLVDHIYETTQISCDKCEETSTVYCDGGDGMASFYRAGWRGTRNHCYCPKCAKKYLKRK